MITRKTHSYHFTTQKATIRLNENGKKALYNKIKALYKINLIVLVIIYLSNFLIYWTRLFPQDGGGNGCLAYCCSSACSKLTAGLGPMRNSKSFLNSPGSPRSMWL